MKLSTVIVIVSFVLLVYSFWHRNDLPATLEPLPTLLEAPRQTSTDIPVFKTRFNGVDYIVEPEFQYDLYGLVVSYRHHDNNSRMHFLANDHLNMLDVCVVWGGTAVAPTLRRIDFWNGIFTCNVSTRDGEAWAAFRMNELSNNHLLSDDESIRERARDLRVGDQVRVRGYLASYTSDNGSKRGTSTTRNDTGNGACETIFVESFEIQRAAVNPMRITMWASSVFFLAGLFLHFRRPYRPYQNE
jgi:hypothetical protein